MTWRIRLIVWLYRRMSWSERIRLERATADVVLGGKKVNALGELK
jgi:hypothetical protein